MKKSVEYILNIASKMHALNKDEDFIIKELCGLTKPQLNSLLEGVPVNDKSKEPEKINKIRAEVLKHLIKFEDISRDDIERIKADVNATYDTNILQSWKSYFKLFYVFFYSDYKTIVEKKLNEISEALIKGLGLDGQVKSKVVGFDGAQNFGKDEAWIALYNKKQPNQSTSLQLFINFSAKQLSYGLFEHLSENKYLTKKTQPVESVDETKLLNFLRQSEEEILSDDLYISYWKFAPGEQACFWDEMYQKGIASIGWGNSDFTGKKKSEIRKILGINPADKARYDGIIENINNLKTGDLIFAFDGRKKVVGYGKVRSEALYSEECLIAESDHHNYVRVDWQKLEGGKALKKMVVYDALADISTRKRELDEEVLADLNESEVTVEKSEEKKVDMSLNQILYGPPGTGKTYNTVKKAVDICRSDKVDFPACEEHKSSGHNIECYECSKEAYKLLKQEKRIEFVTFHQSYGYEEFIEGIKPVLSDEDDSAGLSYKLEHGLLKKIAERSKTNYINAQHVSVDQVDIEGLINDFAIDANEKIERGDPPLLTVEHGFKNKSYFGEVKFDLDGNFKSFVTTGSVKNQSLTRSIIIRDYQSFYDGLIKGYKDIKPSFKSQASFHGNGIYYYQLFLTLKEFQGKSEDRYLIGKSEKLQPYVLIIDEINRGNMSKIFGELITLIEDDKRLGASNEMTVRLPVSGDEFGVPKNLHIIGTMNTADRSIAMMDTALRRRFEFVEMMPETNVFDVFTNKGVIEIKINDGSFDFNLKTMLETINQRIEVLYDREHTIGHAYFMSLKDQPTIEKLASIFENKVIPLLAEYFFEDWEKIRMVLGDDQKGKVNPFIIEEKVSGNSLFLGKQPDFEDDQKSYKRNGDAALLCPESYIGIYKKLGVNGDSTSKTKVDD